MPATKLAVDPSVIVRTKITDATGVWFATAPQVGGTPATTIQYLNAQAKRRNIRATYELATEKEYWDYRESLKSTTLALRKGGTFMPTRF